MRNLRELLENIDNQNIIYINNININNDNPLNNLNESSLQNNTNITNNRLNNNRVNNNRVNNRVNNNRVNNNIDNSNNENNRESNNINNDILVDIDPILASATLNLDDLQRENIDSLSTIISEELTNLANSFNNTQFENMLRDGRRIVMTSQLNIPRNEQNNTPLPVPLSSLNLKTQLIYITDQNKLIYNENCSICSLPILQNNLIRKVISCNHYFHQNCVDIWFSTNSTCPICRTDLIANNVNSSIYNNNEDTLNVINDSDLEEDIQIT